MSNYNNLKTAIDANIKQNGNQEITGPILNSVLNQMVNILGTGYQFAGVATLDPATEPGTPDAKVFYIANGKGTYTNFGGIEVTEDDVVVLYWDTAWHKVATGIASQAKLSELATEISQVADIVEGMPQNYVSGQYLKKDNTIGYNDFNGVTDYIPYTQGKDVIWRFANNYQPYYILFYKADKSFISGSEWSADFSAEYNGRKITASSIAYYAKDAAYLRASFNLGFADAEVLIDNISVWRPQVQIPSLPEQIDALSNEIDMKVKSDLGSFKNSIVTELNTKNFFDNRIGYETGYILSNGTISTEDANKIYSTSVAFPLKSGTWTLYCTSETGVPMVQNKIIYFVDGSDGSVIYLSEENEKITFTAIHDGVIRVCVAKQYNEQIWSGLMLVQGEDTYNFIPYKKYTIIKNSVCLNEDEPFELLEVIPSLSKLPSLLNGFSHYHSVNYFDYRIGKEKGFLKSNGELNLDGVYGIIYYTSNPIHLSAGTWTLYCTSKISGIVEPANMAIHFVDDFDETVIYNAPGKVEKITFTALHNGIFRFSFPDSGTGYEKYIMLVQGEDIVEYAPYDEALIIKDDIRINEHDMIDIGTLPYQNVLFGKKYVAAGDSYTAWSDAKYIGGECDGKNVTYDREIRIRNHMSGENRGISGSSMALTKESFSDKDYYDRQAFSNTRYLEIPEDTDILTIAFGINDTAMCDLGQLGDTENTTFYGAWHKVLSYYAQNRPEMKVGIICFQRSDNDFYRAVKQIAKYYGIPLLDFFGSEDTPMYVDGKAYPVDETIKSIHKAYWCGHAHDEEVKESFRGKEYMTIVGNESPGHPGYRAHIDESTIIEDFLRRL